MDRYGDFTNKQYLYKIYRKGYTSASPEYITDGKALNVDYTIDGSLYGSASVDVGYNPSGSVIQIVGSGDASFGLLSSVDVSTDNERQIYIDNSVVIFKHSYFDTVNGDTQSYYIDLFSLRISRDITANTIQIKYGSLVLVTESMTSSYDYIRIRVEFGNIYVDSSADGSSWVNRASNPIDYENDILKSSLSVHAEISAGGIGLSSVNISEIEAYDTHGNLLAIESQNVLSDLEYTKNINQVASSTNMKLGYTPSEIPSYITYGNYVEIYTQFFNKGDIYYEPILDENSDPILDHNGDEIYGAILSNPLPEETNILKFSGHIETINKDYDAGVIDIVVVSHGEIASQLPITDGTVSNSNVIEQLVQNTSELVSSNRRQTFTTDNSFVLNGARFRLSSSSSSQSYIAIGTGSTTIASSNVVTWTGSLSATVVEYEFASGVQLNANTTYWVQIMDAFGNITWYYQNTDVLQGGSRQTLSGSTWSNTTTDAYFELFSTNTDIVFNYSGSITGLVDIVFDQLDNIYAPLYIDDVDEPGYNVNINAAVDTGRNMLDTALQLSPSGYWYTIDLGTGKYKLKAYPTEVEHNLILGRDFTGFKTSGTISNIVNDVIFIGADLNTVQEKLAIRKENEESRVKYKRGFQVVSNGKVSRYDTANILAEYEVTKSDSHNITSEIFISSAKYNTETIDVGHLILVRNTKDEELEVPLQIASMRYSPHGVSLSLDNAPVTINETVDNIKRVLENDATTGLSTVV